MEDCIAKQQGNVPMKIKTGDEKLGIWENMKRGDRVFASIQDLQVTCTRGICPLFIRGG
jgi:hypothetical protein